MDDNFSNFPEIIVQKLNSIFFKIPILLLTKGQKFFLQVSYENRNRSLFLLVTFLKIKVFYKWDKKENVPLVIWVQLLVSSFRIIGWRIDTVLLLMQRYGELLRGLCYGFPLTPLTLTYSLLLGTKHCSGKNVSCTRGWQAESRGKKI